MKRIFVFCCLTILFVGCSSGPTKYDVTGTVDVDGVTVNDGQVTFEPKDKGLRADAPIKNGKYRVPVAAGSYQVKIFAQKKVPLEPGEPSGTPGEKEKIVNMMPQHYNDGQPLTAEIKGKATIDFKVKSTTPK